MSRRKPSRSRRRRGQRPAPFAGAPPRPAAGAPPRSVAAAAATTARLPAEPARERSVTRFSARDYTYVRREIGRILLLAGAIILIIVILSFFLP